MSPGAANARARWVAAGSHGRLRTGLVCRVASARRWPGALASRGASPFAKDALYPTPVRSLPWDRAATQLHESFTTAC